MTVTLILTGLGVFLCLAGITIAGVGDSRKSDLLGATGAIVTIAGGILIGIHFVRETTRPDANHCKPNPPVQVTLPAPGQQCKCCAPSVCSPTKKEAK